MQIKYVSGSYDSAEGFQLLDKEISEHEVSKKTIEGSSRRLFYFALPPSVYPPVSKMIKNYCMNKCMYIHSARVALWLKYDAGISFLIGNQNFNYAQTKEYILKGAYPSNTRLGRSNLKNSCTSTKYWNKTKAAYTKQINILREDVICRAPLGY